MSKEVIFLAPLPALRKRTRLAKMVPILLDSDFRIRFFGWERSANEANEFAWNDERVSEKVLMQGGGYASKYARALYPFWMAKVFWRVLWLGRGKLFFCLGWETAFPALLAAKITGARVVFDDADRFSMILNLPNIAGNILRWLEQWASKRVTLHIIPGHSRYEWSHSKMVVLRNSPLAADFKAAKAAPPARPEAAVVLYANGWIGETRGAPVFLKLLDIAESRGLDLRMIIAGRVDGPAAPRLASHPKATFLGELSQRDALAWYAVADGVLTYYDPAVPINRKAESNKWGDAVIFGCPIIVNSEVETACTLIDAGAALTVPYNDVEALADLIEGFTSDINMRAKAAKSIASLRPEYLIFDKQFKEILKLLTPNR